MNDDAFCQLAGILARKRFGDREAHAYRLTFGRARISIGPAGSMFYDDGW